MKDMMTKTKNAGHISDIYNLLMRLGVTPNYRGFLYTAYALQLSIADGQRLLLITKHIYPAVARHYRTTWNSVERDIRTVIDIVWKRNPALLNQLAGYEMNRRPSVSQFLAILSARIAQTL